MAFCARLMGCGLRYEHGTDNFAVLWETSKVEAQETVVRAERQMFAVALVGEGGKRPRTSVAGSTRKARAVRSKVGAETYQWVVPHGVPGIRTPAWTTAHPKVKVASTKPQDGGRPTIVPGSLAWLRAGVRCVQDFSFHQRTLGTSVRHRISPCPRWYIVHRAQALRGYAVFYGKASPVAVIEAVRTCSEETALVWRKIKASRPGC